MKKTVAWGSSRGSRGLGCLHGGETETLAGSPWLGMGRSCENDPEGIAGELGSGNGSPRQSRPGCGFYWL